ncbi:MAG: AMP-binding protein [Bacilli bacterium]
MESKKKYTGFFQMLRYKATNSKTAACFIYSENGFIKKVTFGSLFSLISEKAEYFKKQRFSSAGLITLSTLETIINFFALIISGKKTCLIDSSLSVDNVSSLLKITDMEDIIFPDDFYSDAEEKDFKLSLSPYTDSSTSEEGEILFFTSGTSNQSKPVVLTSESLMASAWNGQCMLSCNEGDVILSEIPLAHVFGFVCTLLWPLAYGATIALGSGIRTLISDIATFKPTIFPLVPSLAKYLAASKAFNPELKTILVGAGPIDQATIGLIKASGISLSFGYGLTETSSGVAISVNGENPYALSLCPDVTVKIQDGEILINSSTLMKGYYKNSEATKKAIIDGYLHTGDMGYLDSEGRLFVTGRKNDTLVLANGTKINCVEYETLLSKYLSINDYALGLYQGKATLFAYSDNKTLLNKIFEEVALFNKTLPFSQQITNIVIKRTPLIRTRIGKIRRYLLKED